MSQSCKSLNSPAQTEQHKTVTIQREQDRPDKTQRDQKRGQDEKKLDDKRREVDETRREEKRKRREQTG